MHGCNTACHCEFAIVASRVLVTDLFDTINCIKLKFEKKASHLTKGNTITLVSDEGSN